MSRDMYPCWTWVSMLDMDGYISVLLEAPSEPIETSTRRGGGLLYIVWIHRPSSILASLSKENGRQNENKVRLRSPEVTTSLHDFSTDT